MTDQGSNRRYREELRGAIDSGRTGDKVAYPDPAAAPFGTDDEAAGQAPPPMAVRRAINQETSGPTGPSAARTTDPLDWELTGAPAVGLAVTIILVVLMMFYYIVTHMR